MHLTSDTEQAPLRSGFVAVGHHGLRLSSGDGIDWAAAHVGKEGEMYRAVAFGNGRFVAVGSYGGANIFASTADGETWDTSRQDAGYVNFLRGIGFGKEEFLGLGGDPGAVGDSRPFVMTTPDGKSWSAASPVLVTQSLLPNSADSLGGANPPPSSKNMLRRVAYGNDLFVAVGDRGRRSVSQDAKAWSDVPNAKAVDTLIDVAFGNGVFVGVGLHGLRTSTRDGVTWSDRVLGEEGEHINSIVWTGERFVAVGQGATFFSADGLAWERIPTINFPLIAVFGAGVFVGSNWRGRLLRSADAITWNDVFQAEHHVEAIAFGWCATRAASAERCDSSASDVTAVD